MGPQPTEGKAVTSLVLGLLSIFCFGLFSGIPAIVVGLMSRRDITRSGNTLGGAGLAMGGIVTGALGSAMSLLTLGMMIFGMVAATGSVSGLSAPPIAPPPVTIAPPAPPLHAVGSVEVTQARVGSGALREQLLDARSEAAKAGRTLVVEVRAAWCGATCASFDRALLDPRMQRALDHVRLVEVDVDDFALELAPLSMHTAEVPYFYLLDASAHVEATLGADAWDDNTAANMAPVFTAFLRGNELGGDAGPTPHHVPGGALDAGRAAPPPVPHTPPHSTAKPSGKSGITL